MHVSLERHLLELFLYSEAGKSEISKSRIRTHCVIGFHHRCVSQPSSSCVKHCMDCSNPGLEFQLLSTSYYMSVVKFNFMLGFKKLVNSFFLVLKCYWNLLLWTPLKCFICWCSHVVIWAAEYPSTWADICAKTCFVCTWPMQAFFCAIEKACFWKGR